MSSQKIEGDDFLMVPKFLSVLAGDRAARLYALLREKRNLLVRINKINNNNSWFYFPKKELQHYLQGADTDKSVLNTLSKLADLNLLKCKYDPGESNRRQYALDDDMYQMLLTKHGDCWKYRPRENDITINIPNSERIKTVEVLFIPALGASATLVINKKLKTGTFVMHGQKEKTSNGYREPFNLDTVWEGKNDVTFLWCDGFIKSLGNNMSVSDDQEELTIRITYTDGRDNFSYYLIPESVELISDVLKNCFQVLNTNRGDENLKRCIECLSVMLPEG